MCARVCSIAALETLYCAVCVTLQQDCWQCPTSLVSNNCRAGHVRRGVLCGPRVLCWRGGARPLGARGLGCLQGLRAAAWHARMARCCCRVLFARTARAVQPCACLRARRTLHAATSAAEVMRELRSYLRGARRRRSRRAWAPTARPSRPCSASPRDRAAYLCARLGDYRRPMQPSSLTVLGKCSVLHVRQHQLSVLFAHNLCVTQKPQL